MCGYLKYTVAPRYCEIRNEKGLRNLLKLVVEIRMIKDILHKNVP